MDEKYVNAISISAGAYDFIIRFFKETVPDTTSGSKINKENVVDIRMSPQLAKSMREILDIHIKAYEGNIGEIPSPPLTGEPLQDKAQDMN